MAKSNDQSKIAADQETDVNENINNPTLPEFSTQAISSIPGSQQKSSPNRGGKVFMNLLMVLVLVILGVLIWQRFIHNSAQATSLEAQPASSNLSEKIQSAVVENPEPLVTLAPGLTPNFAEASFTDQGIIRRIDSHTIIPSRSRQEVITYTVKRNDTLFGIAETFNLKPETILWGNFETLQDNPHFLKPDQVLNILPVDGTYYKWNANDNINAVASVFGVGPQAIIDFSGNQIDLTALNDPSAGIQPDQWVIIPGGKRAIKDWGPPAITRSNPASARYYGDGSCGSVYEGAIGTGTFIWPSVARSISGYNYSGIHPAIDIAGATGNAVFAADNGVVVFSGWSNYGYGYMVVIDHGNGFQTAYAHLSAIAVSCGQSVFQGGYIGAVGNTGNSAGSHLHFELSYNGAKLNPLDYLN